MKTVARHATRKIAAIKETVVLARSYSLSNDFTGVEVDAAIAWEVLETTSYARLVDNENGTYNVNVHGNRWYRLYTKRAAAELRTDSR